MTGLQLWTVCALLAVGAQNGARAADAANPYVNIDPQVDAGNATGDEQVEQLNGRQLGLSGRYQQDGWWQGGPTAPPPPGGWWDKGNGPAEADVPPPPPQYYGYGRPPGYYYPAPPPPSYAYPMAPQSVTIY